MTTAIQARYEGTCDICGLPITVGADVVHASSGWIHLACSDQSLTYVRRPRPRRRRHR